LTQFTDVSIWGQDEAPPVGLQLTLNVS